MRKILFNTWLYKTIFLLLILFLILNVLSPQPWLIKLLSPRICPGAVYFQPTAQPVIALTIDDSPHPETTNKILTVLNKYNIKATFFPISDFVEENPEIVKEVVTAKHEIGNHLTKDEPSIKLGESFAKELDKAHQILSKYTTSIKWMRPGGGWCNKKMVDIAKKYNYQVALGSVWSYDTHITSTKFASWFILTNTRPGSIIVLHDGKQRGINTFKTLDNVIPQLQARGYNFVLLSELIQDD